MSLHLTDSIGNTTNCRKMYATSSPILYPATSSPTHESPRKRRKLDVPRKPLHDVVPNVQSQTIGGFLLDESDDEDEEQGPTISRGVEHGSVHYSGERLRQNEPVAQKLDEDAHVPDIDTLESYGEAARASSLVLGDQTGSLSSSAYVGTGDPASSNIRSLGSAFVKATSCTGKTHSLKPRRKNIDRSYEDIVAERSIHDLNRARKSYYGIEIHQLVEQAKAELATRKAAANASPNITREVPVPAEPSLAAPPMKTLLWTEKYRARKFTDLVGDERTHRSVLRWLKAWDTIVFPGSAKPKPKHHNSDAPAEERQHRKVLLLTGPPGLGKTTLAHVCAKQAGYDVHEINASDERSRDVVKGRIRELVETENVRQVDRGLNGKSKKVSRPICVVVDEVDGVVSGNSGSGGEGGFVKALADLLALDQRNSSSAVRAANTDGKRKKKGDNFRLLRPLILICNDVYHPSLRLLRQGTIAEIIYVRKPALNMLVPRMQTIFEKEGVACDSDGVRQLCEAAWGVSNRKEDKAAGGASDGDMRGVLVVAEWVASKIKIAAGGSSDAARLTKKWVEANMLQDLAHGGNATRSLGRGGTKEIVERVFTHNAGFSAGPAGTKNKTQQSSIVAQSAADTAKQRNADRLRELIDSSGEDDRIMSGKLMLSQNPRHRQR